MQKFDMRDWVATLEEMVDLKLMKWRKIPKVENGEAVQLAWQWEQTRLSLNVFWEDGKEMATLSYTSPRTDHGFRLHGLNNRTFNRLQDRIGNLAMSAMHPSIDPEDIE